MDRYIYFTIQQLADDPTIPLTIYHLRKLFANRKMNGLDLCTRKIGTKLFVRKDLFLDWMEAHAEKTSP